MKRKSTIDFNDLEFFGTVRDYRQVQKGDTLRIHKKSVILRRSLHALYELERSAMMDRAAAIGASLQTEDDGRNILIKFV